MKIITHMMNILIAIFFVISIVPSTLFSDLRSEYELNNVALNLAKMVKPSTHFTINMNISKQYDEKDKNKAYKVIRLKPKGWVIVSKDDSYTPIIGYNLESNFVVNTHSMPISFVSWMKYIDNDIQMAKENNIEDTYVVAQWERFTEDQEAFVEELRNHPSLSVMTQKGPLLGNHIQWDQDAPYWDLTPVDNGRHTYVGCIATAIAQIMAYHKWPNRGVGSYSYTHKKYGELSANFDTSYNWTNMTNADKAKISYHMGIVSEMDYGVKVSLAWPQTRRWKKHFKYDMSRWTQKVNVSPNVWENRIKSNIDQSLPINYSGRSEALGGHSFVLEGYRFINNTKVYYFNWGWGGEKNGWFTLGGDFTEYQSAIFDIQPHREILVKPKAPSNLKASNIQTSTSTLRWTDNADNEKGFKLYQGTSLVKTLGANVKTYILTGLKANTNYSYTIKAYNDVGESSAVKVDFKTKNNVSRIYPIKMNQTLSGTWTSEVASKHRAGRYAQYYTFTISSKKSVAIDLNSSEDTYMFLLVGKGLEGNKIAFNDDYKGKYDSHIEKMLEAGSYTIEATTYSPKKTGNFTLSLKAL